MSSDDVQILVQIINQHQEQSVAMLTNFQKENREIQRENRDAFCKIHDRLDALTAKEVIARPDCEKYRKDLLGEIEKKAGVPAWVLAIGTVGAAIIASLVMYVVTL